MNAGAAAVSGFTVRAIASAIVAGGLIAGTLDIFAASLITMSSPVFIARLIAGGLLGKAALHGGAGVPVLGLLLQWAQSLIIAAIFVSAALGLTWMLRRTVIAGLAYGVVVFFVMNYVVVPLSAWHHAPAFKPLGFVENLLAMLVFGLVIAFFARRYLVPSSDA